MSATALGLSSTTVFSFCCWCFDNTSDGEVKGARIMDSVTGTNAGIQLGATATNILNLRIDDAGGSIARNSTTAPYTTLSLPRDVGTHLTVNVPRTSGTLEVSLSTASPKPHFTWSKRWNRSDLGLADWCDQRWNRFGPGARERPR